MVCSSIIYKLRHLLKIFISYASIEMKVNSLVSIALFFVAAVMLLAL